MPENKTRRLTQGAMMIALFTILLAISTYVPLINIVTVWFVPLPLAWYAAKYESKFSLAAIAISIILSLLIGGLLALPQAVLFGIVAFIVGYGIRKQKSKGFLFLSTSLASLVVISVEYVIAVRFFHMDFIKQMIETARKSYEKSNELTKAMTGQAPLSSEQIETMINTIQISMPTLIILCVFAFAWLMISVQLPLLRRLSLNAPKFKPFKDLRLPRAMLWYYLAVLAITLFIKPAEGTFLYVIVLNLSFLLTILFLIQGISFIHFIINQKGWPKWTAVVATILAFPLSSFVTLIGIADLGFQLRELISDMTRK